MLTFPQTPANVLKIDYDNIVTDESMQSILKYQIPLGKVCYNRKGKAMARKTGGQVAATPQAKSSKTATRPKKTVNPKADASQLKKVAKSTTNSRQGDRTPSILAQLPIPKSRSSDTFGKEVLTTSALTAPPDLPNLRRTRRERL